MEEVPDADQGLSYGMPAFKVQGKTVAGFAAFTNHLSYLPHSGSVLAELGNEVVARDHRLDELLGHTPMTFAEASAKALAARVERRAAAEVRARS